MVNTQLLEQRINDKGMKLGHIADKLGITRQTFRNKVHNVTPFRAAEVYVLCELLDITDEKEDIFLSEG